MQPLHSSSTWALRAQSSKSSREPSGLSDIRPRLFNPFSNFQPFSLHTTQTPALTSGSEGAGCPSADGEPPGWCLGGRSVAWHRRGAQVHAQPQLHVPSPPGPDTSDNGSGCPASSSARGTMTPVDADGQTSVPRDSREPQ